LYDGDVEAGQHRHVPGVVVVCGRLVKLPSVVGGRQVERRSVVCGRLVKLPSVVGGRQVKPPSLAHGQDGGDDGVDPALEVAGDDRDVAPLVGAQRVAPAGQRVGAPLPEGGAQVVD